MDVNNLLRTFERHLRGENLSENTVVTYLGDILFYFSEQNCVKENVDPKKFSKAISKETITNYFQNIIFSDKYKNNLKLKGKLRRTASKKISAFSKFFTYLEREGILDKNYLKGIDRTELIGKHEKSIEHKNYIDQKKLYLFVEELEKLYKGSKDNYLQLRDVSILFVLVFSGLRASEVANISIGNIDLDNNIIKNVTRKRGEKVEIPIESHYLKPAMTDYVNLRKRKPFDHNQLFTNNRGGRISRHLIYKIVEKYSLKSLGYRVHPHTFRHTFATCLLLNGATTAEVKTMLDHKNIASTEVYEHVNEIKTKYNLINNFYKK